MTYSERKYKQKISLGQRGNAVMMLIAICLVLFVIFAFIKALSFFNHKDQPEAISFFHNNVLSWVAFPADFDKMISRPWTIITHMFVHDNIWKVFANMLWLWSFGYIMQDLTGNKKIIPIFIYGAFAGAVAFMLAYNLLPSLHVYAPYATTLGASAGVMAIAIATTLVSPGYRLFPMIAGGIPLWVLTALYLISDFATVSANDTGTLIAHITGGLTGFLFIFFLRMGFDWSAWMNNFFDWAGNLFNPDKPRKGKSLKEELFYKSAAAPYKKTSNITQQRVDEILDKINQKGYHFLTDEEKELLKRASKEEL